MHQTLTGPVHHLVTWKRIFPRIVADNIWLDSFSKMVRPSLLKGSSFSEVSLFWTLTWIWILVQIHDLWNCNLTDYIINTFCSKKFFERIILFLNIFEVFLFLTKFISYCFMFISALYFTKSTQLIFSVCSCSIHYSAFMTNLCRNFQETYMTAGLTP